MRFVALVLSFVSSIVLAAHADTVPVQPTGAARGVVCTHDSENGGEALDFQRFLQVAWDRTQTFLDAERKRVQQQQDAAAVAGTKIEDKWETPEALTPKFLADEIRNEWTAIASTGTRAAATYRATARQLLVSAQKLPKVLRDEQKAYLEALEATAGGAGPTLVPACNFAVPGRGATALEREVSEPLRKLSATEALTDAAREKFFAATAARNRTRDELSQRAKILRGSPNQDDENELLRALLVEQTQAAAEAQRALEVAEGKFESLRPEGQTEIVGRYLRVHGMLKTSGARTRMTPAEREAGEFLAKKPELLALVEGYGQFLNLCEQWEAAREKLDEAEDPDAENERSGRVAALKREEAMLRRLDRADAALAFAVRREGDRWVVVNGALMAGARKPGVSGLPIGTVEVEEGLPGATLKQRMKDAVAPYLEKPLPSTGTLYCR